jgi:MFS transporter, Spinster family, sphingosine-1-phosphate transporter
MYCFSLTAKFEIFIILQLFFFFFLNFKGILSKVKEFFMISDSKLSLLQTLFLFSFSITAPFFGYLSDRYSRKWIIVLSICLWAIANFLCSFVPSNVIKFLNYRTH